MVRATGYSAVQTEEARQDGDVALDVRSTRVPDPEVYSSFDPPADGHDDDDALDNTDGDNDGDAADDRQRLLQHGNTPIPVDLIGPPPTTTHGRRLLNTGGGNDGVFANMSAKPEVSGEDKDEMPPTYEQASLDNAPPYWDTTMYLPGVTDEVFIDGLPVGHFFGFIWNMIVSMSFQFVGFLLTYVLHTTHASKQGSRAGLGITLIQYGFYLRSPAAASNDDLPEDGSGGGNGGGTMRDAFGSHVDFAAYALIVLGWIILTKSTADFLRVRRMEQCVRETSTSSSTSPTSSSTVVGPHESPEQAV